MTRLPQRVERDLAPQEDEADRSGSGDHDHGREIDRLLERPRERPGGQGDEREDGHERRRDSAIPACRQGTLPPWKRPATTTPATTTSSSSSATASPSAAVDFEERVTAAAVRLGLVSDPELDEDETADLVELVERDAIETPRSALGEYLVRHWDALALVRGESLVYWLKKLVFRGAWLDHRVKEGLLEVDWDDERQDFTFADTNGGRALLELLPTPSWHELQYRR